MKVTRVVVGKGRTNRPSDAEEWLREYYEIEIQVESDREIPDARKWAMSLIDKWLSEAPTMQVPGLDPEKLEGLPWTSYQTKQRCKPGEAGWIFSNTEGAEALVDLIKTQGKDIPVTMGEGHVFLIRFSGKDNQFISRRPKK